MADTPTPEMVEHAARAIHDAGYCLSGSWRPWEEWHSPSYREIVRDQARAAIKAMREPTATMLEAGRQAALRRQAKIHFNAMINAAPRHQRRENGDG